MTTKDDLSRDLVLPPEITRVISLAPNVTEMLYAVGAGDKVVGTDDFSNHPPLAARLPKVGGMQPDIEKIVALEPDVVIASTEGNHPNLSPALSAAGIPLFVVRTDRLDQVPRAMARLGAIATGRRTEAAVSALKAAIEAERRTRTTSPRILFVVWTDPLYVAGRDTFTDDLFALTGARNAVEIGGWPQYSLEHLVTTPPDLILYPSGAVTPGQINMLRARVPHLAAPAVAVDPDIFQRPGPRLAEAAKILNEILDRKWPAKMEEPSLEKR